MHPRLIHRRSISAQLFDVSSASTVVSTSFSDISPSGVITFSNVSSPTLFDPGVGEPSPVTPLPSIEATSPSVSPETIVTILASIPTSTSSSQSSIPQPSSLATPLSPTSLATSTVYQSTETITMTTQLPQRNQSPLSSSTAPSLALTSRDGIVILSLSIVAGILSILCGFVIWRRCKRHDQEEALEIDPISFHQSGGKTESLSPARPTNLYLEALSPLEVRSIVRDRDSPIYRISRDSAPSSAITPTHNALRFSPAPDIDIFDSRWPGRLVPLVPQRASGPPLNNSLAVVSGENDDPSGQSVLDSGSQAITTTTSNLHLARLDGGNVSSGSTPLLTTDAIREKRELERIISEHEAMAGRGTWDEPPPESEKAESIKEGPPAYSPGSKSFTHTIPSLPPDGVRPLPNPPSSSSWRSTTGSDRRRSSAFQISLH